MKVLMFEDNEMSDIYKVLAALLHMGNITYKGIYHGCVVYHLALFLFLMMWTGTK